jgi:CheY-like chemotaxis protein
VSGLNVPGHTANQLEDVMSTISKPGRILVVDDAAPFRNALVGMLRLAGYDARGAADGAEARQMVDHVKPDLILLDLSMPNMKGVEFLRLLRHDSDPVRAQTPVILLTAVSDPRQVAEAEDLTVEDCLVKSMFSIQELVHRVERRLSAASGLAA